MKKKVLAITLGAALAAGSLAGCGEKAPAPGQSPAASTEADGGAQDQKDAAQDGGEAAAQAGDLSGDLVFAIWDNNLMDYIDENDMVGKFQEKYPNADIEVEKIKDDSEYWNAMKMRTSLFIRFSISSVVNGCVCRA